METNTETCLQLMSIISQKVNEMRKQFNNRLDLSQNNNNFSKLTNNLLKINYILDENKRFISQINIKNEQKMNNNLDINESVDDSEETLKKR